MNLRVDLACVVIAVFALILSDVADSYGAVQFCSIYPERCQYSSNGKGYYYPLGYPVPGATGTPKTGSWGCAATGETRGVGRSWSHPSQAAAAETALGQCRLGNNGGTCRIVRCSASVRTLDEAHAILRVNAHR